MFIGVQDFELCREVGSLEARHAKPWQGKQAAKILLPSVGYVIIRNDSRGYARGLVRSLGCPGQFGSPCGARIGTAQNRRNIQQLRDPVADQN